jgi:hypothetical protein
MVRRTHLDGHYGKSLVEHHVTYTPDFIFFIYLLNNVPYVFQTLQATRTLQLECGRHGMDFLK